MIMCFLLCYPVSFHMLQLLLTGRPISSSILRFLPNLFNLSPEQIHWYHLQTKSFSINWRH